MKVNLLPLTRLFMFQCLLTMIIALPFSDANAQRGGGHGGGHHGGGHCNDGHCGGSTGPSTPGYGNTVDAYVNSYLQQGDKINLNQSLQLQQIIAQGKQIVSLSVKAQSTQYNSQLVLKLNGQRIQAQSIGTYMSDSIFSVPMLTMGDKLVLVVQGGAFVQSLQAQLSYGPIGPGPGPGPGQQGILRAQINQQIHGQGVLAVRQLVHQATGAQLMGAKVDKVILKASSVRGHAQAQLLIDGRPVGYTQTIPVQQQRIVFDLPNYARNIIGQDIQTIKIKINGQVHVQMVGLKLAQGGQQGGMSSVQVQVNQRFQGSQRVSLSQLVGYGQQVNMQRQIEAITIVAQGHGNIMMAGAGQGQGGISVQGPTTQSLNLMGQMVTGQDLKLRIQGNIVIQSIRIKFKQGGYYFL